MIFVGFDYIRKKKRPAPNGSENPMSVNNIIKKRLAAMENLENKDENDISKEIKGWVLNKGVGESVLHKASRLDYVVSCRSVKSLKNEKKKRFLLQPYRNRLQPKPNYSVNRVWQSFPTNRSVLIFISKYYEICFGRRIFRN